MLQNIVYERYHYFVLILSWKRCSKCAQNNVAQVKLFIRIELVKVIKAVPAKPWSKIPTITNIFICSYSLGLCWIRALYGLVKTGTHCMPNMVSCLWIISPETEFSVLATKSSLVNDYSTVTRTSSKWQPCVMWVNPLLQCINQTMPINCAKLWSGFKQWPSFFQ